MCVAFVDTDSSFKKTPCFDIVINYLGITNEAKRLETHTVIVDIGLGGVEINVYISVVVIIYIDADSLNSFVKIWFRKVLNVG